MYTIYIIQTVLYIPFVPADQPKGGHRRSYSSSVAGLLGKARPTHTHSGAVSAILQQTFPPPRRPASLYTYSSVACSSAVCCLPSVGRTYSSNETPSPFIQPNKAQHRTAPHRPALQTARVCLEKPTAKSKVTLELKVSATRRQAAQPASRAGVRIGSLSTDGLRN